MSATVAHEDSNVFEPNVIYEDNPQILADATVYKMWYTGGWDTPTINYAESADGQNWTKYGSNPVIEANHARSYVFKDGSTYLMYTTHDNTIVDLYTSSDGVSWTLDTANVLTVGAFGAWDGHMIGNVCVWKEGSNWYMLYDAEGTIWKTGLATSSDGRSWTKSASNPVISSPCMGGPWVKKAIDGYYYLWVHGGASGNLPTDIWRYRSTNLTTWTPYPGLMLERAAVDEGQGVATGQLADVFIVERDSLMYLYATATPDGASKSGGMHIKLWTAPIARIIT